MIPLARHIAEKVHAYTRTYGEGRTSTRVKDLVDIILVALCSSFQGDDFHKALATTLISAAIWLGCYLVISSDWLSFRHGWLALPAD